jgi:hypothetical protein
MRYGMAALLKLIVVAITSCVFVGGAAATNHYVASNGTASGNGSITSPWDLQTALNQPSSVQPGDTIWVRGGTYVSAISDGFTSYLTGTATSPIIVRNYNGERATIDGQEDYAAISVEGSYTWYWGLEIMSSCTMRYTPAPVCAPGVGSYGAGNKFINLVVHDTTQGFSAFNASPDNEFYGNLSYYNGYVASDRNHGHGMYLQNISGTKTVSDNFVFDNANEGIQIYGSGNASLINFVITGNTLFDNNSWPVPQYQYNLIIAGGQTRKNITVQNNYSYFPAGANAEGFAGQFGQYSVGQDITVTNNVFANGYNPVNFTEELGPVVFTGNTVVAATDAVRLAAVDLWSGETLSLYTWDNNTYYDQSLDHFFQGFTTDGSNFSGVNESFASWQAQTKFDTHSTYMPSAPTGVWVYVRPNNYEAKRANVTIFNWDQEPTVLVDLSGVLSPGDQYVIQDAQNFYGPAVESGVYSGNPVAIRMTGLVKAVPMGFPTPAHTAPEFGTFIVLPVGAPSTVPPPPPSDTMPPSVSISSPAAGSSVSGTVTVTAVASDNIGVASVQFTLDGVNLGSPITAAPFSTTWATTQSSSGSHTLTAIALDTAGNTASASITVAVNNAPSAPAPTAGTTANVTFVRTDATTQGSWYGVYGADGYAVAQDSQSSPAYATFDVQGEYNWTWSASTTDPRALQTGSGSGRIAAAWYRPAVFGFDVNFTDGKSHQFALYALDWDTGNRAETIQVLDAGTGAVLDSRSVSNFGNGLYLVWNISGHVTINVTKTSGPNGVVSGIFFGAGTASSGTSGSGGSAGGGTGTSGGTTTGTSGAASSTGTTANFVVSDAVTQGSWEGKYGADGYALAGIRAQSTPIYAPLTVQNGSSWTWAASTTDLRALQAVNSSARIAAAWYSTPAFSLDVNFSDGKPHQFALYAVDWDSKGRSETIQVLDATTTAVLDTRNISGFTNGIYLVWNISGHVTISVTSTSGPNAVVSGIFFGTGTPNTNTASAATFTGTDTTTQGNWKGIYGLDGYDIPDTNTNVIPAYVAFTPQNQANWTWTSTGTEPRDLQVAWSNSTNIRQASCWYTFYGPSYSLDVNIADGNVHQFELYALDYDSKGRAETIQVTDAVTGAVLDTRSVSNFTQGIYYIWKLSGHVKINVTVSAGPNAVISGAFFD